MIVFELLKEDHKKVDELLTKLCATSNRALKAREKDFMQFKKAFFLHKDFEENVFYPLLRENKTTQDLILESYEEHTVADRLIKALEALPYDDATWGAKISVLKEAIAHHVKEEERSLFPQAKKILSKENIQLLTQQRESWKIAAKEDEPSSKP